MGSDVQRGAHGDRRSKRPSRTPEEFHGTERFQVVRRLGAGGMGYVYEALDKEKQVHVALKTLRTTGGDSVLGMKREFRSLQDVQHPNLVSLGELIEEDGVWFFTMELIRGVDFLRYVRPGWAAPGMITGLVSATDDTMKPLDATPVPTVAPQQTARFDEHRLRAAIAQLCRGLMALHAARKVHRDVKPSNVLVTADERVVILDFGLATNIDPAASEIDSNIVGTAIYMAPEQALGGAVGPEADWYSVGVVLYEALLGVPPFQGPNLQVLMDKQKLVPPAPKAVIPTIPDDLSDLAMELLQFDPAKRPTGRAIQRRLGFVTEAGLEPVSTRSQSAPFVGRDRELEVLQRALADVRGGKQVTVSLYGESGIGKSALVRAFTRHAAGDDRVVVLAGRCYEREAVPYKAVDGVVDELASLVQRLPRVEAAALTPQFADLLLRVFPVLSRIDVFAMVPQHAVRDAAEQRARLFMALRELLLRLSDRRTVIMAIDDLQWADADSLAMLSELLRPPDAPNLLFLAGSRTRFDAVPGEIRHLPIEKLSVEATTELARVLLQRGGVPATRIDEVVREANGHPLFVDELVRFAAMQGRDAAPLERFSLAQALGNRIARLDPGPLRVLELLSLAGSPLDQETCAHAAGVGAGELVQTAAQLRTANLARTGGARKHDRIEPYHARVRDAVLAQLDPDRRRALHGDLARALESSGKADPEALVMHHHGAGANDKAARYAIEAAAAATRALAFDHAARLYQMALDLQPNGPGAREVQVALGAALAKAGRGVEAATALLAAASGGGSVGEALDLRARAIQALLYAGSLDQGIAELRDVLTGQGVAFPKTSRRALLSVIGQRLRLALRGLKFVERDESQVAKDVLARIDLIYYASSNLAPIDTMRGHAFQVRGLRLALQAGERYRVARALVGEAGYRALPGVAATAKGDAILAIAEELGKRVDNPHLASQLIAGRGTAAFLKGEFATALERCRAAVDLARQHGMAEYSDTNLMFQWIAESLLWLGRLGELRTFLDHAVRDAEERGNQYLSTTLRTSVLPFVRLADDDVTGARFEIDDALTKWSPQRFHVQHFYALRSHAHADLYAGDGAAALARLRREWSELKGALLLQVSFVRTYMWDVRARAAIAAGELDAAAKDAKRIAKERFAWSAPLATMIRACIAARRGAPAEALFADAARGFDAAGLALHAAVARRRSGSPSTLDVANAERVTAMLAP